MLHTDILQVLFPSIIRHERQQDMTHATEIVTAFMQVLEAKEFTRAAGYLSDAMILTGFTPAPLSKKQFINVMSELAEGFPNLAYNFHGIKEEEQTLEGSLVRGLVGITGTQVDSFKLPELGIGPIPQLAGSVSLPEEQWEYLVDTNTIASIRVVRKSGGGMEGLLNQLGVHDPIIQ
jgi:hypothetical protein